MIYSIFGLLLGVNVYYKFVLLIGSVHTHATSFRSALFGDYSRHIFLSLTRKRVAQNKHTQTVRERRSLLSSAKKGETTRYI